MPFAEFKPVAFLHWAFPVLVDPDSENIFASIIALTAENVNSEFHELCPFLGTVKRVKFGVVKRHSYYQLIFKVFAY